MTRKQIITTIANGSKRCVLMLRGISVIITKNFLSYKKFSLMNNPVCSPTKTEGIRIPLPPLADIGSKKNKQKLMSFFYLLANEKLCNVKIIQFFRFHDQILYLTMSRFYKLIMIPQNIIKNCFKPFEILVLIYVVFTNFYSFTNNHLKKV